MSRVDIIRGVIERHPELGPADLAKAIEAHLSPAPTAALRGRVTLGLGAEALTTLYVALMERVMADLGETEADPPESVALPADLSDAEGSR